MIMMMWYVSPSHEVTEVEATQLWYADLFTVVNLDGGLIFERGRVAEGCLGKNLFETEIEANNYALDKLYSKIRRSEERIYILEGRQSQLYDEAEEYLGE